MSEIKPGTRIETKSNPITLGTIQSFATERGGLDYYHVRIDGEFVSTILCENQFHRHIQTDDPWQLLINGSVKNHKEFGITSTFFKVGNNANNTISTLTSSRTTFLPHQFKPLIKFLNSVSKRILIADEVGVGKTIEAGHILLEMYSRKEINSVLIICPKSLQEKWRDEMFNKFNFEFTIYETKSIKQTLNRDIQLGRSSIFGIITYDKLKSESLSKLLIENQYQFDMMIIDEAHLLRNNDTLRHNMLTPIIQNAKYVAMLTATPLCNSRTDLFNILHILEPQRYTNESMFNNELEGNRPFVHSLNALNAGRPFKNVLSEIQSGSYQSEYIYGEETKTITTSFTESFVNDPLYHRVVKKLKSFNDTPENRVDIQRDLSDLNSLSHIFTRTRKREVTEKRVLRNPHKIQVNYTDEEMNEYMRQQMEIIKKYGNQKNAILALIGRKKQVASSINAYLSDRVELENGQYFSDLPDSKFAELRKIIQEVVGKNDQKLIIFAYYKNTLRYLKARIQEEFGNISNYIDGESSSDQRFNTLNDFKENENFKILISGSIGAEGLDMQFCNAIVNYDLPWNPMRIEQRIGRIDRIGQKSPIIHIYNLVVKNTIEDKIYDRLLMRIKIFEESLGDLEAILLDEESLGANLRQLERDLYTQELSDDQMKRRIDQTAIAMETEKQNLQIIESELTDNMVNDSYFYGEIDRIKNNKRYITKYELVNYIQIYLNDALSGYSITRKDEYNYIIHTPANKPEKIFEIIEESIASETFNRGGVINKLYFEFKRNFYGSRQIGITFDQQYAFDHQDVEFVNASHPLVIAATHHFKEKNYTINNAFGFSINKSQLDDPTRFTSGNYLLALNKISIVKTFKGETTTYHYLYPVTIYLEAEEENVSVLNDDNSEYLLGVANTNANPLDIDFRFDEPFYRDVINEIRPDIIKRLIQKKEEIEEDETVKLESLCDRIKNQTNSFYKSRIEFTRDRIKRGIGIKNILEADIKRDEAARDKTLEDLNNSSITATMQPISVSHIQII